MNVAEYYERRGVILRRAAALGLDESTLTRNCGRLLRSADDVPHVEAFLDREEALDAECGAAAAQRTVERTRQRRLRLLAEAGRYRRVPTETVYAEARRAAEMAASAWIGRRLSDYDQFSERSRQHRAELARRDQITYPTNQLKEEHR